MATQNIPENSCDLLDIGCHLDSFAGWLESLPSRVWATIVESFLHMLAQIPVPDWLASVNFSIPGGALWFAGVFELQFGISIMLSAWLLRFLIRRIPIIG